MGCRCGAMTFQSVLCAELPCDRSAFQPNVKDQRLAFILMKYCADKGYECQV